MLGQTVQGGFLPRLGECDEFPAPVLLGALQLVHLVSAVGTLEGEHFTEDSALRLGSPPGTRNDGQQRRGNK